MQIIVGEVATIPLDVVDRVGRVIAGAMVPDGGVINSSNPAIVSATILLDRAQVTGLAIGTANIVYSGPLGSTEVDIEVIAPVPFAVAFAVDRATFARAA